MVQFVHHYRTHAHCFALLWCKIQESAMTDKQVMFTGQATLPAIGQGRGIWVKTPITGG